MISWWSALQTFVYRMFVKDMDNLNKTITVSNSLCVNQNKLLFRWVHCVHGASEWWCIVPTTSPGARPTPTPPIWCHCQVNGLQGQGSSHSLFPRAWESKTRALMWGGKDLPRTWGEMFSYKRWYIHGISCQRKWWSRVTLGKLWEGYRPGAD